MHRKAFSSLAFLLLAACNETQAIAETPTQTDNTVNLVSTPETSRSDNYTAFASVVAKHQAMSDRVTNISRRLRVANAPLCDVTRLDAGLTTHQLIDYPAPLRPLALHFMDLGEEGRFIRSIAPGSPADHSDLEIGDQILSGWPLSGDTDLITSDGPMPINADTACVAPAFVIDSPVFNASTDGREIILSTALVEHLSDETSLAFIIAHEMAHILRGHSPDGPRWVVELQADADALTLMRNAGYDVRRTVEDWESSVDAHRQSQSMSATHPPISIRLRNLEAALERLETLPESFIPLSD